MAQITTTFSDGSQLEYDNGKFDSWCVYLTRPNVPRFAPRDFQYFTDLKQYAKDYGRDTIYNDFVSVYDRTTSTLSNYVFEHIKTICSKYGDNALDISITLSIIYMGMVAEENKAYAKLKKRIKRLGVYQVLYLNMSPMTAANFSRGKGWKDLAVLCNEYGF